MSKEVDIENSKLILRLNGTPESGGNRNNYVEIDGDPARQRVGGGGGLGMTGNLPFGDGYDLIGSTGVSAHIASNVGISADRAEKQHDSRYDAPLAPHAMGAFEMRDVLNQVVGMTGGTGDLGRLTVGQAETLLNEHPNLITTEQFAKFSNVMTRLETPYSIPQADVAQAQDAINSLYNKAVETGTANTAINASNIGEALARASSGTQLPPGAEAVVDSVLSHAGSGGNVTIAQLYNESQALMPALTKSYVPADYVRSLTLSQVNAAAESTQAYIADKGGPDALSNQIVSNVDGVLALTPGAAGNIKGGEPNPGQITGAINSLLTANGEAPLSAGLATEIQNGAKGITSTLNNYLDAKGTGSLSPGVVSAVHNTVSEINTDAGKVTSIYQQMPSGSEVRHYDHLANTLVALDPELEARAFVAAGLLTPHKVNAGVVAQQGAVVNVEDAQYVASDGFGIHPDITRSIRGEVGVGQNPALSFSQDTARKLNLSLPHSGTQAGAYVFAEQDTDRWAGLQGTRNSSEVGIGASIGKAFRNNTEGVVTIEGGTEHTTSTVPGDTPKNHDNFVGIKGIFKF